MQKYFAVMTVITTSVISAFTAFFARHQTLKKHYAYYLGRQKNSIWTRTTSFSDKIVIDEGKSSTQYEYSEISSMSEDDKCFYLFLNEDMVLRILKDSFILGACDDFREFANSTILNKSK